MAKEKSKPKREAKKPAKPKAKSLPVPTPSKGDEARRDEAVKRQNARVRHAIQGNAFFDTEAKGVTVLSGRQIEIPGKPTIMGKGGTR